MLRNNTARCCCRDGGCKVAPFWWWCARRQLDRTKWNASAQTAKLRSCKHYYCAIHKPFGAPSSSIESYFSLSPCAARNYSIPKTNCACAHKTCCMLHSAQWRFNKDFRDAKQPVSQPVSMLCAGALMRAFCSFYLCTDHVHVIRSGSLAVIWKRFACSLLAKCALSTHEDETLYAAPEQLSMRHDDRATQIVAWIRLCIIINVYMTQYNVHTYVFFVFQTLNRCIKCQVSFCDPTDTRISLQNHTHTKTHTNNLTAYITKLRKRAKHTAHEHYATDTKDVPVCTYYVHYITYYTIMMRTTSYIICKTEKER